MSYVRRMVLMVIVPTLIAMSAAAVPRATIDIQLLDFSDWHGQLDPIRVGAVEVGGAAYLSSYFKQERLANPNTLTVTAGDAVNASPQLSNFFNEEPAIKALDLMGVDVNTLGNHDFDRGIGHLQQMIDTAGFEYVSANLANVEDAVTGIAPWTIRSVGGVEIGIVGVTNPEASQLVKPGSMGPIIVTDPVPAANRARAEAQAAGAEVTVAITHLGISGFDANDAPFGPLIDFANNVGGFDVIVGDHTDIAWSGVVNGHLVVENRSKGLSYSRIVLSVDPLNGRIARATNTFVTPRTSAVVPDPAVIEMLQPYRAQLSAVRDTKIGEATAVFPRGANIERLREVAIGNLIADGLRETYGTQLAVMNGGGIRASLPSSYAPVDASLRRPSTGYAAGPPFDLVIGDVHTVLPFGNVAVTRTVTGAQLRAVLNHSISSLPGAHGKFLQISGFRFTYQSTTPASVVEITLADGTPVTDAGVYTLTTNDFMNAGGDGYTMLADGNGTTRDTLAQVLHEYIMSKGTITPYLDGRITRIA